MTYQQELAIRRSRISMVFQEPAAALNPVFTVGTQMADVVRYAELAHGKRLSRRECLALAEEALAQVFIPDPARILKCYPNQLSGGMKQRVCIAMSIVTHRDLLIADEPGTALDVTIQAQVHSLINRLYEERGMSLIMVSHSLGVAREMTDRIYIMYAGNIVETAPTAELFRNTLHPYTRGLLDSVPKLTGTQFSEGIYGYIPDYNNVPEGCRFCSRCPKSMEICKNARPAMKELSPGHFAACFLYGEEKYAQ
ncbi:Oligopeptide transport ATP-binding protein OppD [bioreactor metagenome]|uniref:Oligopeptide transport ATP-binding protein OppD n=1 Tax=bioreactor metagenome TaxID=1076179 RepID=A0A644YEQ7_9ZZZZ